MTDPNMRGTPPARQPDSKAAPTSTSSSSSTPNPSTGPSKSANTSNNANTPSQPSLASRIQSSATGLARSALTGPSDYAQTLNTATQGKAATSSSALASTSASGSGSSYAANPNDHVPYSSSSAQPQQQTPAPTFRNTTTTTNQPGAFSIPNITEEEFQRVYTDIGTYGRAYYDSETGTGTITGIDTNTNAETDVHKSNLTATSSQNEFDHEPLQSNKGPWKGKHRLQDPVQLEYTTAWERASPHTFSTEPLEQNTYTPVSTDGDAVSALLSDPSFDAAGYDEDDNLNYNVDLDLEAELAPLSDEEVKMLESFRRDMGIGIGMGSGSGFDNRTIPQGSVPLSSVSLVPDIDAFLNEHDPGARTGAVSLRDRVLSELPGSNEWVGVQERYHDEVWGYLRPALEAAREEIEEKEKGVEGEGHDGDGPAVRRLKMILKHMGG